MLNDITPVASFSKQDVTTDVTGQLAVAQRTELFSFYFTNTDHNMYLFKYLAGTGSVTWTANTSAYVISAGTASSSLGLLRTKYTVPYKVGQGHTVAMSLRFGTPIANGIKSAGIADANDGLLWQMDVNGLAVVNKTSTSGSPVDTVVYQANWNIDKLDGTGPSGFNLNTSNVAVYVIEYTWHGAGRVRFGVKVNKDVLYCHEFDFDNSISTVYNRSPVQPIAISAFNTGTTGTANTFNLYSITAMVHNQDAVAPLYHFAASRGTSTVSVSGATPLIGIRPKTTFKGVTNRITALAENLQVSAGNSAILVQVVVNPTTVTGPVWVSAGTESVMEYDISATAVTGGIVINEFYVASGTFFQGTVTAAKESTQTFTGAIPLVYTGLGPQQDTIYLVARSLGGSSASVAAISWEEYQ